MKRGQVNEVQGVHWRRQLKEAARTPEDLLAWGVITEDEARILGTVTRRYETLIPPYYLSLIDRDDPACPIRKQAIPSLYELEHLPGEETDPIGDRAHAPTEILVHRYPDRVLLFPTYRCPMFCRYCFRKDTLNGSSIKLHQALPESLAYLKAHPEIEEVILSGGDPLILSTARLSELLKAIISVGIQRLRLHSRFPVTLPQRVDSSLCDALASITAEIPLTLVTHFNHPKEITPESTKAVALLKRAGVTVLNQSVLLAGINDEVSTLKSLCRSLLNLGVLPYYLHHPDLTAGTQHFRVTIERGLALSRALRGGLSGLGIPTYVIDLPGGGGKVPLDSQFVQSTAHPGQWKLESPLTGEVTLYRDLAHPMSSGLMTSPIESPP